MKCTAVINTKVQNSLRVSGGSYVSTIRTMHCNYMMRTTSADIVLGWDNVSVSVSGRASSSGAKDQLPPLLRTLRRALRARRGLPKRPSEVRSVARRDIRPALPAMHMSAVQRRNTVLLLLLLRVRVVVLPVRHAPVPPHVVADHGERVRQRAAVVEARGRRVRAEHGLGGGQDRSGGGVAVVHARRDGVDRVRRVRVCAQARAGRPHLHGEVRVRVLVVRAVFVYV